MEIFISAYIFRFGAITSYSGMKLTTGASGS